MPWCYEALCIQARLTPEAAAQLLPEHDGPGQAPGEGAHETPRIPSLPAPLPMEGRLQAHIITSSTWQCLDSSIGRYHWGVRRPVHGHPHQELPPTTTVQVAGDAGIAGASEEVDNLCSAVREQHWESEEEPGTALAQSQQAARDADSSSAAEAVWRQKAEKWKARCHRLQQDMNALSVEAAARDAALQVRPPDGRQSIAEERVAPCLNSSSCALDLNGDLYGD